MVKEAGMDWVIEHWDELLVIGSAAVTIASVVAKLTPTKSDDVLVDKLLRIVHKVALNPTKDKARE